MRTSILWSPFLRQCQYQTQPSRAAAAPPPPPPPPPPVRTQVDIRHARIVNRPASLQRPHKRSICKPAEDMRLGSVDRKGPAFRLWVKCRTLLRSEVVVGHACKECNDDMRSGYLEGVEDLYRSFSMHTSRKCQFGGTERYAHTGQDDQIVVPCHSREPNLRISKIQPQEDRDQAEAELCPCLDEEITSHGEHKKDVGNDRWRLWLFGQSKGVTAVSEVKI